MKIGANNNQNKTSNLENSLNKLRMNLKLVDTNQKIDKEAPSNVLKFNENLTNIALSANDEESNETIEINNENLKTDECGKKRKKKRLEN